MDAQPDLSNSKYEVYQGEAIDLSGDTYVNQLMADRGAPVNPYAEIFDTESVEFMGEHREEMPESDYSMLESSWDTTK